MSRRHFNPRPPRGGRPQRWKEKKLYNYISIHAPREGGDRAFLYAPARHQIFQSTPPARGATWWDTGVVGNYTHFNPRPPRGGRRCPRQHTSQSTGHFNPRPPRGGRRRRICSAGWCLRFQSTPPARGATLHTKQDPMELYHFNPRPPRGGRQQRCTVLPADL